MYSEDGRTMAGRAEMAIVGAVAGLAMWVLFDKAEDITTNPHVYLALVSFAAGFFAVLLGLSGPHRVARAALPALLLGVVGAALLTLAGLRFETLDAIGDAGHPIAIWMIFLTLATPFAAVRLVQHEGLTDYGRLFDTSWSILVRYSAAWLFAGLILAVAFLSHELLEIVGISVIDDLLRNDPVRLTFIGFALGLGLSVVHELRQYLSPYLVLRMLRMLVPVVLVVVAIFAAAAVMQGPDQLFGSLSRAATLLTVSLMMISLISIALDRSDADAIDARWMRWATAALALLLPVIAGLAAYAIWLRVAQYGWTPQRLLAATVAFVVLLYAVAYPICVLFGAAWMARVRRANVWIAAAAIAACAAWMSPVLNAERISTADQVMRAETGETPPNQVPLREMQRDWGVAGQAGLAVLTESSNEVLAQVAVAVSEGRQPQVEDRRAEQIQEFLEVLVVRPQGELVTAAELDKLSDWNLNRLEACGASLERRCVLIFGQYDPADDSRQAIFLRVEAVGGRWTTHFVRFGPNTLEFDRLSLANNVPPVTQDHVKKLIESDFRVAPPQLNALWIGDLEILPTP